MKTYALLFASGFVNDSVLTAYYVYADRGHVFTCVGLCAVQQALAIFQAYHTLLDAEVTPRERLFRLVAAGVGYVCAAYFTVQFVN